MEWLEGLKGIVAIEQRACKGNSLLFYAFALARAYVKPNGHQGDTMRYALIPFQGACPRTSVFYFNITTKWACLYTMRAESPISS